ncbi:hypothetical protein [Epinotia aporema granulovirus]|uniref:Uncharacterized protein n=1 Tax=Epinotia aporema granulovirus TaxID=166056 RepID=K4EQS3_9BBAC|nr:hypothetical protein [Epinotia aporema granulovirus]AER41436.1 hypothetical protein [Epinotia aporema granulovirus]
MYHYIIRVESPDLYEIGHADSSDVVEGKNIMMLVPMFHLAEIYTRALLRQLEGHKEGDYYRLDNPMMERLMMMADQYMKIYGINIAPTII